jgi:YtcA family
MKRPGVWFIACLLLGGCHASPSIAVLGAFFPDWQFCIAAAIVATAIVHVVLNRRHRLGLLDPLALSYPALTTLFSLLAWLLFFSR